MDKLTSRMLDEIVELYFNGLSCMEAVNKIKEKYKLFLGGI